MWRLWVAGAVLFVGTTLAVQDDFQTPGLTGTLPAALPDTSGWERMSGAAEFSSPHHVVEYALYVSPERGGVYSLAHYRITFSDPDEGARNGVSPNEMLQWDLDGRRVRRFECARGPEPGALCAWRELHRDSPEFERETPCLLLVYALHRKLLSDRDAAE